MKKLIAIIAVALPLAFSARAQWIVYDPISNVQQILDQAENIAEYVDMVENQVQQIETLDNQLSEFKNYESLFGNPSQVVLSMVPNLDSDLQSLEPVVNLENLVASADGNYALTYNDSGIYATVGVSCVLRALSDSDSNFCRTGFRFLSDSILISVGQGSGRLSDGFWAGLEWCPTGLERCPAWPGMVSDREWNPERKEWSDAGMGVRVAA